MSLTVTPVTFALDSPSPIDDHELRKGWGSRILFSGWAHLGPESENAELSLEFVESTTGLRNALSCERVERPDVASYLSNPAALRSGFEATLNSFRMAPGLYSVNLLLSNAGNVSRIEKMATLRLVLHDFELTARTGLAGKFLFGNGIEIGALQRKLAVPEGCQVRYVDRMPLDELLRHYPELAGFPLQSPDIIDDGEKLDKVADHSQNFVIANHFLEHSRNPIQTLFNLARVLTSGGTLYMAVPDKRYTKDFPRSETSYESLKQTLQTGKRDDVEQAYQEWAVCWEGAREPDVTSIAEKLKVQDYSIHFNVWTLSGLLQLLLRARSDFQLPLEITSVVSSDNENIFILTRS
jgi:SAM-dependent methyltransferase